MSRTLPQHTRRIVRLADGVIVEDRPVANQRRVERGWAWRIERS